MIKIFFGYHDALKNYGAPKLCTVYVVKSPVLGLQRAPENSELAPSVLVLSVLWYTGHCSKLKILMGL